MAVPGEPDPLVLLPGSNCSAALWSGLGLPETAIAPVLGEPTLDRQVDRLLDELPERFACAGLSLGGIVAMALVRRAPERVSRLCLLSTNAAAPVDAQRQAWRDLRAGLAGGTSAREIQGRLLGTLLSPEVARSRPDLVETTMAMADEVGEPRLDAQLRLQATRIDERPALARVRCPTLVVAARDDVLCGLERHQEIAAAVPGARLRVVDRCAHLSTLERPDVLGPLLRSWHAGNGE